MKKEREEDSLRIVSRRKMNIRDLLGREPPEPPESSAPPED